MHSLAFSRLLPISRHRSAAPSHDIQFSEPRQADQEMDSIQFSQPRQADQEMDSIPEGQLFTRIRNRPFTSGPEDQKCSSESSSEFVSSGGPSAVAETGLKK